MENKIIWKGKRRATKADVVVLKEHTFLAALAFSVG